MSHHRRLFSWLAVFVLFVALTPLGQAAPVDPPEVLVRIWLTTEADATRLAAAPLTPIARESLPQPYVLARSQAAGLAWLAAQGFRSEVLDQDAATAQYVMADTTDRYETTFADGVRLFSDSSHALWRRPADAPVHASHHAWTLNQVVRLTPRAVPLPPTTITPIALVQEIIDQVDLSRLMVNANEVSGQTATTINGQPYTITTRHTNSGTPITQATHYMIERLQRLGLTVTTHTWNATRPPNVIAEKPGLNPGAGIYIICAHLDDMPSSGTAPGADDNGSGSVAVLHAAEILTHYNFDATLRFVLFTGEEQGLLGSAAYANLVQNQDVRGVLNMDMIAWDNQGGPDMDLHAKSTVAGSMALAQIFADVVTAYQLNLTPVVYSNGATASDHSPFWNVGIPAFLVIENYWSDGAIPADFNAYYHSSNDRTTHYNQPYFHRMVKASVAAFAHIANIRTDCYWADLNCDEVVTALDLTRAANHWSTSAGQWNYSRVYDADDNGVVDVVDVQRFAAAWGWISPG